MLPEILRISKKYPNFRVYERLSTFNLFHYKCQKKKKKIVLKTSENDLSDSSPRVFEEQTRHEYFRAFFYPSLSPPPFSPIVNHVQRRRGEARLALGRWPTGKPYIVLGLQSEHRGWINLRRGRRLVSSPPSFFLLPLLSLPLSLQ